MLQTIRVAEDFSPYPGGRFKELSNASGEEFREKFLIPALKAKRHLKIELDGTSGYPSSFLEEAFGGLIRLGYDKDLINELITLDSESKKFDTYVLLVKNYIEKASNVKAK